jgi:hypothetical protein
MANRISNETLHAILTRVENGLTELSTEVKKYNTEQDKKNIMFEYHIDSHRRWNKWIAGIAAGIIIMVAGSCFVAVTNNFSAVQKIKVLEEKVNKK